VTVCALKKRLASSRFGSPRKMSIANVARDFYSYSEAASETVINDTATTQRDAG
jgi:hypothetical protein